jgi:hypothetical protein
MSGAREAIFEGHGREEEVICLSVCVSCKAFTAKPVLAHGRRLILLL